MAQIVTDAPLFANRRDAGLKLVRPLEPERAADAVVVGLARGGVVTAAAVADALALPLDVVAVRKVGHPWQPEYAIGAVTPDDGVFVRGPDGLTPEQVEAAVADAKMRADVLDARLHEDTPSIDLDGRRCILVDDGLATGATMIAAVRWARSRGAARIVGAVPVAAGATLGLLRDEADAVVCPYPLEPFFAVGVWYAAFEQVGDEEVKRLLAASARALASAGPTSG